MPTDPEHGTRSGPVPVLRVRKTAVLIRVMLVLDSRSLRKRVHRLLPTTDLHVTNARPNPETWSRVVRDGQDLIVTSPDDLPSPPGEYLRVLGSQAGHPDVVVLAEEDDAEARADWLTFGAAGVVSRFLSDAALGRALGALIQRRREVVVGQMTAAQSRLESHFGDFVSQSVAMIELLDLARRVAPADTSLLLLGETGVGKEWLARAIHGESPRGPGPFVAVNCAALPEGLLESELFGHVEGAFTGAIRTRRGYFELAHGGTLFLDEIADMPLAVQAKLLRAIQERSVQPLGAEETIAVDVRIMGATNRDLLEAVESGDFRSDLFYRLGVVSLRVPSLRERREDIPVLAETYLERFAVQLGRPVELIEDEAMRALVDYDWPGNVRELINVLERGVLLARRESLHLDDLPRPLTGRGTGGAAALARPDDLWDLPLADARDELVSSFERAYLERLLRDTGGRVGDTAERAGIDARTLYNKMQRYELRKESYR